jgi:hypothetical protein
MLEVGQKRPKSSKFRHAPEIRKVDKRTHQKVCSLTTAGQPEEKNMPEQNTPIAVPVNPEELRNFLEDLSTKTLAEVVEIKKSGSPSLAMASARNRVIDRAGLPLPSQLASWAAEKPYVAYPKFGSDVVTHVRNGLFLYEKIVGVIGWMRGTV